MDVFVYANGDALVRGKGLKYSQISGDLNYTNVFNGRGDICTVSDVPPKKSTVEFTKAQTKTQLDLAYIRRPK